MNEKLEICSSCRELKILISCDAYGEYCSRCDELNWLSDNDFPDLY